MEIKNIKIWCKNQEESKLVQEQFFKLKAAWVGSGVQLRDYKNDEGEIGIICNGNSQMDYLLNKGDFNDKILTEIKIKDFLKGKIPKEQKPTHIVIWIEDTDPHQICYDIKEAKTKAKELLSNSSVQKDSIRIFKIIEEYKVETKISLKKVK